MNTLTKQLKGQYVPVQAIVIYNWKDERNFYMESHEIENGKLLAGKPLTEDCLESVVEYFSERQKQDSTIKGLIPQQVLFCEWTTTSKKLMWYNPPKERMMHFTDDLHIPSGKAWQPGLVYMVMDGEMRVFATKTLGRPVLTDALFVAPYHNCSHDGSVCLGSAKVAKPKVQTYESLITYYELLFWGSEFSHLAGTSSVIQGNINTYWKQAIKNHNSFDFELLLTSKKNMEKLLAQIS